jgi:hypothetical protein
MKPLKFMKSAALTALAALGGVSTAPATAANVDVGVSVQISQPGVYGRIDIGTFPQPQVIVAQPVLVTPPPPPPPRPGVIIVRPVAPPPPVYMWVPPGHQKDWTRHCSRYNACGVPVYFVRDDWYYQNVHPKGKGKGKGQDDRSRGKGKGRND